MDFEEGLEKRCVIWTPEGAGQVHQALSSVLLFQDLRLLTATKLYTHAAQRLLVWKCVTRILKEVGVSGVDVVPERAEPDRTSPHALSNPEFRRARAGPQACRQVKPKPFGGNRLNADRMGCIPHNESVTCFPVTRWASVWIGYLPWLKRGEQDKVAVSTIVSSAMPDVWHVLAALRCAAFSRASSTMATIDQLKDAGEEIASSWALRSPTAILLVPHARDKDAIVATMLCVEMASWYAARNMDLYEAMDALYQRYGYYLNGVVNAAYPGAEGCKDSSGMSGLRKIHWKWWAITRLLN